jgi:uncharacterized protein YxjI
MPHAIPNRSLPSSFSPTGRSLQEIPAESSQEGPSADRLSLSRAVRTDPESPLFSTEHQDYRIAKRFFSLTPTYDIYADGKKVGKIRKEMISLTPSYELYDATGEKVGRVSQKLFAFGFDAKVTDGDGKTVGKIEQAILRSTVKPSFAFKLYDAEGKTIAKTDPAWFTFTGRIDLEDPKGKTIGHLNNRLFSFRESYNVHVTSDLDRRMVLALLATELNLKEQYEQLQEVEKEVEPQEDSTSGR